MRHTTTVLGFMSSFTVPSEIDNRQRSQGSPLESLQTAKADLKKNRPDNLPDAKPAILLKNLSYYNRCLLKFMQQLTPCKQYTM